MKIRDLPKTDGWLVFEQRSIRIPGDERSRTHPGHGYPASTQHYLEPRFFHNKNVLLAYLESNQGAVVYRISPLSVSRVTTVSLST